MKLLAVSTYSALHLSLNLYGRENDLVCKTGGTHQKLNILFKKIGISRTTLALKPFMFTSTSFKRISVIIQKGQMDPQHR